MKLRYVLGLAFAVALTPVAHADSLSPDQKKELGDFIKDYLVSHPEVLRAAIDSLHGTRVELRAGWAA